MADRKTRKQAGAAGKSAPRAKKPAAKAAATGAKPPGRAGAATRARAAVAAVARQGAAVRKTVQRRGKEAGAAAKKAAGKAAGAVAGAAGAVATQARRAVAKARGLAARTPGGARPAREPDPESYFVARVRGEEAVRDAPHPMTEAALEAAHGAPLDAAEPVGAWDEQLGDLPWSYGDDALVALPRDPRTLFVYWDHGADTVRRSFEGLKGGKAELWVFARGADGGWERVRVLNLALDARGWYVHDLAPGRVYRAEIHAVDASQDRLVPNPSNECLLPPAGPSPVVDDRFARLRWEEHLSRWLAEWKKGGPFAEELRQQLLRLSDWSRFAGETWGGASAGGMGGRPSSPAAPPGSPSSPWGGGR